MHVQKMLEQAHQLPSIPKVVQELLRDFDDPNVDAGKIAAKLQLDQALTAKVLRLANSSFYGGTRKVSSVNDAVVLLGVDSLRTMVAAGGVVAAFKAPEGFDLRAFWRKSFMVAGLCRWLVKRGKLRNLNAETAFTGEDYSCTSDRTVDHVLVLIDRNSWCCHPTLADRHENACSCT